MNGERAETFLRLLAEAEMRDQLPAQETGHRAGPRRVRGGDRSIDTADQYPPPAHQPRDFYQRVLARTRPTAEARLSLPMVRAT
jgi:hypothetical protein